MSQANIPNITPEININRKKAIDLLLASIALEELGLSHIINAEAEKIQFVLGTLPDSKGLHPAPDFNQLLMINRSVQETLKIITKKEAILEEKLEDVLELIREDD